MTAGVLSIKLEAYAARQVIVRTWYVGGGEVEINICFTSLAVLYVAGGRLQADYTVKVRGEGDNYALVAGMKFPQGCVCIAAEISFNIH